MSRRPGLLETEQGFLAAVVALAKLHGWMAFHPFWSVRSTPGYPDLTLVKPPRLILAELKSARGQLTPAQAHWLALLRQVPGIEVYEWRPCQWDEIQARLQGRG
jgi:hypothetical protein